MKAHRGSKRMSVTIAVAILLTLAGYPIEPAAAQDPKIAFLNPSSFSLAGERGYIVSNSPTDTGPDCCAASDGVFRFSAWVADAPAGASVFFTVVQGALDFEIIGRPTEAPGAPAPDTWDASWDIPPEVLNGPATVNAYLVLDNEPIAQTSREINIMRVLQAVDLAYPSSGGPFGLYTALGTAMPEKGVGARKKSMGVIDALYTWTPDMNYVRSFYTTSQPGMEPVWKVCATEIVPDGAPDNGLRCVTDTPADAASITAVAAVGNNSPGDYDERFNQSGDAVRAIPYAQQPTQLALNEFAEQRVSKNAEADRFYCSSSITATLTDQVGRLIPAANIDVEATGPSDGLRFHTHALLASPVAPDRGKHTTENGFDCTGSNEADGTLPTNAAPDTQGEHPVFGAPDLKHVESAAGGTSDRGAFAFRFYSNASGSTQYTAWVDETDDGCLVNDDRFTTGEVSAAGSIGWNDVPETPALRNPDALVPCAEAPPPPPPTPDPPAVRTLNLRPSDRAVTTGTTVRLKGRLRSAEAACLAEQSVVLRSRRPGGRFRAQATGLTSAAGRYSFEIVAKKTRHYRVTAPATDACGAARSRIAKLRVT